MRLNRAVLTDVLNETFVLDTESENDVLEIEMPE